MKKVIIISIIIIGLAGIWYNRKINQINNIKKLMYSQDWSYDTNWEDVVLTCGQGKRQSPINIISQEAVTNINNPLNIQYTNIVISGIENVAYAVNAYIEEPATIQYQGKEFSLIQFHSHADSEHTLDGQIMPLELHLVHSDSEGELTVLGILFSEGEANPTFQKILDRTPPTHYEKIPLEKIIDITQLMPTNKAFYSYDGSLTTPECNETVNWIVFKESVPISSEQIKAFLDIRNGKKNNRPIQEIGNRVVQYFGN
ncbi:MAG: carbonic anhydrase family protein [Brevinema sp.]